MALQTKTFIWGSYVWGSESNAYVLELVLTENSVSQADNTSNISYTLRLKSGAQNRFQSDVTSTLKLNGVTIATKKENKYLDYNSTWTLLSGTATVAHNSDGSLNMPIVVSIDTTDTNAYAPPDKTLTWSWALTAIPRASAITSAGAVILGNACSVRWTPNSNTFRYKLKFSLGSWSYTTGAIHPNTTGAYTYTGYKLPLEVAKQITGSKEGTVTVTLTTYSDSGCTVSIGSDSETFKVTIPENADTKPTVTMKLTPAETPLAGLYLQGKSSVQATLSATAKLGASIKSYSMTADGKSYKSPYLSGYLTTVGNLKITGSAVDSREIKGYAEQTITVLPYYIPKLTGVKAYRCTAAGVASESGKYLKIEATRDYAPVVANGVQRNFCRIRYRYKAEKATQYSEYVTILEKNASGNSVATAPLTGGTLSADTTYTVQILAEDDVGQKKTVTRTIPGEEVFRHKRAGGKGLGLGGYCEKDNLLDVHWNGRIRKNLQVDGATDARSFNGVYIASVYVDSTDEINIHSKFAVMNKEGWNRQSIFLFGNVRQTPVYGVMKISDSGEVAFSGIGDVQGTAVQEDGRVTIKLPGVSYDQFVLISGESFSIIN